MNLLEAINDSIIEDSLIEETYYTCLDIENALQEGEISPSDARYYLQKIMESANIKQDLLVDVIEGGPFNRLAKASRILLPIRESRFGETVAAQVKTLSSIRGKEKKKGRSRAGQSAMNLHGGFNIGYDKKKSRASSSSFSGSNVGAFGQGYSKIK